MKLAEYSGSKTVSNMTSVDMGISEDPTDQLLILNVLSNTLYTDKVTAVWREYGCNAYDANVEAGKPQVPIEITLPSRMVPEAKIRDFGFGMTEEQVLQVFCKLGRSTKRGSNELVGMLGIGSKAGFAYGDNFTVTCWAKGEKTIYTCFRDQGVPRLSKMHAEPSNAPEGVEIKVPVRIQDIPDFLAKAERVFRFFKVRPIVHGGTLQYQARGSAKFSGPKWRYIGDDSDSYAVMGNIGYRIDETSLPSTFGDKRKTMLELGVELDFNIGELEISANREGLQMKDQTLKSISAVLDTAIAEIAKDFSDKVKTATCLWEAKKLYHEAFQSQGRSYGRTLKDIVGAKIVWNGKALQNSYISVENTEKDTDVNVTAYTRRWGRSKCKRVDEPDNVPVCDDTVLVINDLPKGAISPGRVRHWFDQHSDVDTLVVFTFATAVAQPRFFTKRELTGAPTMKMSDMPKPPPSARALAAGGAVPSAHRAKHSASAFTLKAPTAGQYYTADSQYWEVTYADLDKDGVWVKIEKFIATAGVHTCSPSSLQLQAEALRKAGLLTGPLYAFKTQKWDKVKAASGWKQLGDHLKDEFDTLLKTQAAKQELANYMHAAGHQSLVDVAHRAKFPTGSLMRDYLEEIYLMRNPASGNGLKWNVLFYRPHTSPWIAIPDGLPKATTNLKIEDAKVFAKYPMLKNWDSYTLRCDDYRSISVVVDYVKLVEDNT